MKSTKLNRSVLTSEMAWKAFVRMRVAGVKMVSSENKEHTIWLFDNLLHRHHIFT